MLARVGDDDAAWRAGARRVGRIALAAGLAPPDDLLALRRRMERRLSAELIASGRDPEFPHQMALARMFAGLGATGPQCLADSVAAWELRREAALTRPIDAMTAWVGDKLRQGARIVATSDTRYTGAELAELFAHHGFPKFSAIYASADFGASKFSGRLFDIVAANEGVDPRMIQHMGDNRAADVLSAGERRLAAVWTKPPSPPIAAKPAPKAPAAPWPDSADSTFGVGYTRLGPILTAFARLLLERAERDGVTHLAFVARDGDLLLRVTRILVDAIDAEDRPTLTYLHLSRRAMASPPGDQGAHGDRILRYLRQTDVLNPRTALVDIGWAGSTGSAVAELAARAGEPAPFAYYLGRFDENAYLDPDPRIVGLLGDQRRSRGPLEGAAWQAAFLLEAICRASHGTVVGFAESADGHVEPLHAARGAARSSETETEPVQGRVRAGILSYARWWSSVGGLVPTEADKVRRAAQVALFKLAFFPSAAERDIAHRLVHTETDGDEAGKALALPSKGGARAWFAGIRSPWKGAYFRDSGGLPLAALYCVAETIVSASPPGVKSSLSRILFGRRGG